MTKIIEKFRLNFSRCINRDVAPLNIATLYLCVSSTLHASLEVPYTSKQ